MKMTELDISVKQDITEGWSQKYKSSINCSHPKGFSQKAHCAGKKKHTESVETEMTCPDCGMCKTHGSLNEIKKGAKDSNGFTKCWPGKHAEGTKKGKNGKPVRNCVPNESVAEGRRYSSYHDELQGRERDEERAMGRGERDMDDESNLLYIYKNDRIMQKMVSNRVEREARAQGYRDTVEQALKMHGIIRSKFNPKKWVQKQGTQWVEVHPFGKPDTEVDEALPLDQLRKAAGVKATNPFANAPKPIEPIKPAQIPTGPVDLNQFKPKNESATAGATSAANVGVGAVYKNKPVSQPKNKNGTAKNALDMKGANLLGGGSIKR
jgi:hypothetical protein